MATVERDILPDTIKPSNYALSLYDMELGGKFSYQGTVSVTVKIIRSTKEITLNAVQLQLHSAEVQIDSAKTQTATTSTSVTYDEKKQRATISFPEEIPACENALIIIKFAGTINHAMAGFYRSRYNPAVTPAASVPKDGDQHVMFSTQFESSDARRAFPCWDEPNLKATYDVELEIPEDQVALSNMPEKYTTKSAKDGFKIVTFDRTPIMSSYLLAWAIGDFEYVEDFTKKEYNGRHLPVRVYTTRGLKEQGRYALEHAGKIIDYFSDIFKIEYPLPKADLLAVHEFSHGAMENWGLVTYRTTAVLFDEATSDAKFKNRVAYVVAHELAHQWFGNLVTMDWWSELWLNEGFATWVGWLATDYLHPDWNVWPQFVSDGMQTAYGLDALRSSHPIEVPVRDALDVDQIFDAISYLKGSSVIRMLATHLGVETFLNGVAKYLQKHAYGNATTADLWSALSDASGQNVNALMDPWIRKIGYPVLTVAEELGQVTLSQSRYLSTGDVQAEEDTTTWWIPLGISGVKGNKSVTSLALTQKLDVIRDVDDDFYKINANNAGFYRTNYPPARLVKLGQQLDQLSTSDKIGLVGDVGALTLSGAATTPALLAFIENFGPENDYLVWSQITSCLGTVKSVFSDYDDIVTALKSFTLKLTSRIVKEIGWKFADDEDYLTGQLRALLISTAGMNGDESVIAEAQRQFSQFASGDTNAIHPSLRSAVFQIAIRNGGKSEYDALKSFWTSTTSIDGKELAVRAMARLSSLDLLDDYFNFLFNTVAVQDQHVGAAALSVNSLTRPLLWKYIQEHFDGEGGLRVKLGENMVVLDRFLKLSLNKFADSDVEKSITAFFDGRDNRGYDRTLGVVSDTIKTRAGYKARDLDVLREWLSVHGYMA